MYIIILIVSYSYMRIYIKLNTLLNSKVILCQLILFSLTSLQEVQSMTDLSLYKREPATSIESESEYHGYVGQLIMTTSLHLNNYIKMF